MPEIENTIPVLNVRSLEQSIEFYERKLGFTVDWGGDPGSAICSISRDGHSIMLARTETHCMPGCVWIGLESDRLIHELADADVEIQSGPVNQPWAYELRVFDPDRNVLWFGAEPKNERADQGI